MMAHIEMEAMRKFPIERLSYDLKLELLENMDARDIVELVNVNQGFRSIVVREPWRIFGKHVDEIEIDTGPRHESEILKFESRIYRNYYGESMQLAGSSSDLIGLDSYSACISKIRSTQKLNLGLSWHSDNEGARLSSKLLRNLDSVSELEISIRSAKAKIEKYLTILTLNHIRKAKFFIANFERNERMLRVLSDFVVNRLNHCKRIDICDDSPHYSFWLEPLSKIWAEIILFEISSRSNEIDFGGLVHRIVTKGIPSSNPEAAIILWDRSDLKYADNSMTGLLSRTPGICRIAHDDRGVVREILEQTLDEINIQNCRDVDYLLEGVYFTRSIDSNRKCIYVTGPCDETNEHYLRFFLAKYITVG